MTGEYTIEVWNKRVRYNLKVRRNITIITGDSGTGKTTLINLIDAYDNSKEDSGVHLICDRRCVYLHGKDWKHDLSIINNSIVFIDEHDSCLVDNDFATEIKNTDNYYVIIARCNLSRLPYSVYEIYGLREARKDLNTNQVYNEQFMLFGKNITESGTVPDVVVTEDSNSGYDFFKEVCNKYGKQCIPANGKSNIKNLIGKIQDNKVLIIADGAAFGSEMEDVILKLEEYPNYSLYLPESFEWLLLKAGTVRDNNLDNILKEPYKFIESSNYFSWERYFTDLIIHICANTPGKLVYKKSKIHKFFLQDNNINKVLKVMKKIRFN